MKLVSIQEELLALYSEQDKEVLYKAGRPYVLVLKLRFKGRRQDFAIPLRSNIPAAAPKYQYFPLPPRPTTRPRNRHGLHYIKMFPVNRRYLLRYRTEGNDFATKVSLTRTRSGSSVSASNISTTTAWATIQNTRPIWIG